jgi:3'(2'), 5'-bisphosphate nucleotidase
MTMATRPLATLLPEVVALAEDAGAGIEAARRAPADVRAKADGSPVSKPDLDAHALIVPRLRALTPGVPVVSEEGAIPAQAERAGWREFWLVDPLDGTKEYLAGLPDYTVNIALVRDGQPVLGVVHAPGHAVTYWAAAGVGSWRRRGHGAAARIVAQPPAPGAALRVAESRSHGSPALDDLLRAYRVRERIAIGSSLKFCLVADGTADCYIRLGPTMEWDVAAGDCVFRWATAGDTPHASPLTYNKPGLRNAGFVLGFLPPRPAVVWFTGLSGAGKSTIATALTARLQATGAAVELLDGDVIRGVFPGTGFTRADRDAHIRRVGYMASRLEAHGVTVIASLVSPYQDSRAFARGLCREFVEVYVATPLAVCEARDTKGLYAKARAGAIAHFTGLDDPYEPPEQAEIVVDTAGETADAAAGRIVAYLQRPRLPGPEGAATS